MNCSTPSFPVLYYLPEFAQIHIHCVNDAIQSTYPLSPLLLLPSILLGIRVFSNKLALHIGAQSIGSSASSLVFPKNIQACFSLGLAVLISLQSKGLSRVFSNTTVGKHQFFSIFVVKISHLYMTTGKTIALTRYTFAGKMMCLLFNVQVCHSFSSKEEMSFNFMAVVSVCNDFGAQGNKVCHCFLSFLNYLHLSDGTRCHDLSFLNVEF